jgi:hypothetical protein
MPDQDRPFDLSLWGMDLRPDPGWEEQKARLWAMTRDERVRAMRAGELSRRLCLHWAAVRPHELPILHGEWKLSAIDTPEVAPSPPEGNDVVTDDHELHHEPLLDWPNST